MEIFKEEASYREKLDGIETKWALYKKVNVYFKIFKLKGVETLFSWLD